MVPQGPGRLLAALRAAWPGLRRRMGEQHQVRALEHELALMADRVAQAELLAQRQAVQARRSTARAVAAEDALVRLQDSLDHARRRRAA
jgi:hypothetical protein